MSRPFLVLCLAVLVGLLGVMSVALQKSTKAEQAQEQQNEQSPQQLAQQRREAQKAQKAQEKDRQERTATFRTGMETQKKREAKFKELAAKYGVPHLKYSATNSMDISNDWSADRVPGAAGIDQVQREKELREKINKEVDAAVPIVPVKGKPRPVAGKE